MVSKRRTRKSQIRLRKTGKRNRKMRGGHNFNTAELAFRINGRFYIQREHSDSSGKSVYPWPMEGSTSVVESGDEPVMIFKWSPVAVVGRDEHLSRLMATKNALLANYDNEHPDANFKERFVGHDRSYGPRYYISLLQRQFLANEIKDKFADYEGNAVSPEEVEEGGLYIICYNVVKKSSLSRK